MIIIDKEIRKQIIDSINSIICLQTQQTKYKEKALAEIIEKYDFFVGSKELKHKLMKILPTGANIVYSPYIEHTTNVYAVKKFDIMDLFSDPYKEDKDK